MKTLIIVFASLFFLNGVNAQSNLEVQLTKTTIKNEKFCVNVELTNPGLVPLNIDGQNIRIFYNSEKLRFENVFLNGQLPIESYDLDLQSDVFGLQSTSSNQLDFDNNMGFVNYTITAKDFRDHNGIIDAGQNIHAHTICFKNYRQEVDSKDIVLAAIGKTDQYSKAYTMTIASAINEEILLPTNLSDLIQAADLAGLYD